MTFCQMTYTAFSSLLENHLALSNKIVQIRQCLLILILKFHTAECPVSTLNALDENLKAQKLNVSSKQNSGSRTFFVALLTFSQINSLSYVCFALSLHQCIRYVKGINFSAQVLFSPCFIKEIIQDLQGKSEMFALQGGYEHVQALGHNGRECYQSPRHVSASCITG